MPYRMSGELASEIDFRIATKNLAAGGRVKHWQNKATSGAPKNAPNFNREILARIKLIAKSSKDVDFTWNSVGERGGLDPMIKSQWNPEIQGKNIEGQFENQRKTLEAQGRKALETKMRRA